MESFFRTEGYFDDFNYGELTSTNQQNLVNTRRSGTILKDGKYVYQLMMIPTDGFLMDNKPLPPNVEMALSFARQEALFSTIKIKDENPDIEGVFELKDCFAKVEYVSSKDLRDHISNRNTITYKYDDLTTKIRSIPQHDRRVRLENLVGGNTPLYLFAGITKTPLLLGSNSSETISFLQNNVKTFDILLNGKSCHGYPMVNIEFFYPI
ncbi:Oidioi.mRNA.OKI2018_I69.YSR.g17158.t1.cds [Oikopleura dioica]|uniref:Oidioi.mRNA.OKI2018_I69.YSR.g17158.t1.cds n=1 Tax=Oikopleura dioica TaxID=34765 RepID=A0ABN7SMY5_OIKDI|nr:Oidioi.mRNA.OKI2018_I69.YSR.g17158.t1.cds [Oikopleura dioica]